MLCTGGLQQGLMLVGELDKDVFEAGSERANFGDGNAVLQELVAEVVEIEAVFDERMDGLAENGRATYAGEVAQRMGSAVGDELAEINVGYVAAALGFVHVVGGDEEGDAVAGKLEEEIPELAARDGVDASGGFVEEKKRGLVQHGAAEGEALLPATGKLRSQAIQIGCEAVELDNFVDAALQARGLQAVDTAVELQVFRDGQIVVETEILRHVTDVLADVFGIGADVEAFNEGGAAAERQESGEHFDDGGFAATVGAEETEDLAFFDAEADVVDGGEIAETAHKILRGDSGFGGIFPDVGHRLNFHL